MINQLIEQIGGRERLETILSWREKYASPARISLPLEEVEAMARSLLAVLDAKPFGYAHTNDPFAMMASLHKEETRHHSLKLYATPPAPRAPGEMTPEMMRAVQLKSELGAYAAANMGGAYGLFDEFWKVAMAAAPAPECKK